MLALILMILKIIGIILLGLIGLVVLILCLVLFAPVKYKSSGYKKEDGFDVSAFASYLNPIVRIKVHYPDDIIVQVKICGFSIYPAKENKVRPNTPKEIKSHEVSKKEEIKAAPINEVVQETKETEKISEKVFRETAGNEEANTKAESKENDINADSGTESSKKESKKDSILDTVGYYSSLLSENKSLILNVIKTVLKAFKTVLPRKCRIQAVFGTGQADTTGFIYAAYCALEDSLPGEIYLEPVWTESHIEGEYYLQGKIRFIHFLVAAIKVIINKEVRLLIKKLRRM